MSWVGYCSVKSVSLALLSPSVISAAFGPVLNHIPVVPQVGIFRELLVDRRFQAGRVEEVFEIVRIHFLGEVEIWKFMLTGPRRDHRFERTLHSVAGEIIPSIVLSVVEQKLRVLYSKNPRDSGDQYDRAPSIRKRTNGVRSPAPRYLSYKCISFTLFKLWSSANGHWRPPSPSRLAPDYGLPIRSEHYRTNQAIGLYESAVGHVVIELRQPVIQCGGDPDRDRIADRLEIRADIRLGADLVDGNGLAVHCQSEAVEDFAQA